MVNIKEASDGTQYLEIEIVERKLICYSQLCVYILRNMNVPIFKLQNNSFQVGI